MMDMEKEEPRKGLWQTLKSKLRNFKLSRNIGIDLGTATVLVYVQGKGIVLEEPSVVAVDTNTDTILQVGKRAQQMLGRTPGNIEKRGGGKIYNADSVETLANKTAAGRVY